MDSNVLLKRAVRAVFYSVSVAYPGIIKQDIYAACFSYRVADHLGYLIGMTNIYGELVCDLKSGQSGFVDVGEASSALDLLELVAALAEELLDAPLAESAQLICIDAAGGELQFTAADDLAVVRRAAKLRVDAPPRKRGLFGANRR